MRKPVFCICENKGADQLLSTCAADRHFFIASKIVQFLNKDKMTSIEPRHKKTCFCGFRPGLKQLGCTITKDG